MSRQKKSYEGIVLTAPVTVPYQRFSANDATWFIGQALRMLLGKSQLKKTDIDGLAVSSFTLAPDTVASLTEHFDMMPRWLESLPFGGASAVIAAMRAARAVQNGDADVVACIGGDTAQRGSFRELAANFSRFSRDAVYPYGGAGPNAIFAMITRNYMTRFGADAADFGHLCVEQRKNAAHNPNALLRKPLSLDDYLNARLIAEPLRLFDCVMPCAGAEGFLVMTEEKARRLSLPFAYLLSAEEQHNSHSAEELPMGGGWRMFRDDLYNAASCGPEDMDFLQTYDDYPVMVFQQLEDLGFCGKGTAADFVRSTDLSTEGSGLPHNTCGGQLSVGQAGFAGGFLGMVEGIRQLTRQPMGKQVADAELGLVSGFGMVNYDRGLCAAAAVLKKGEV